MARWYNEGNSASEDGIAGQRFNLRSGGRTRHVINIASPQKPGTVAYTFTETTSAPSSPTDGYKNDGLQKNLHVLLMNNNAGTCKFQIWGYHAFAGQWGLLQIVDVADGSNAVVEITMAANVDAYTILPIEGIERIAVQATTYAGGNSVTCYLGVNSI
tara:strand:- start:1520 stop:1993 length:474 start_codon:yes stop_codon:yes gene_type:complete